MPSFLPTRLYHQNQLRRRIIEVVNDAASSEHDRVHYLLHHCVVQDKTTSKFRIAYKVSVKTKGHSLIDCLYMGPSFGQSIWDQALANHLIFCFHQIALKGDIEAFLMVSVQDKDCNSLRFLWTGDVNGEIPDVMFMPCSWKQHLVIPCATLTLVLSDNGKPFSLPVRLSKVCSMNLKWRTLCWTPCWVEIQFEVPLWGGIIKHMIKPAQCCLKSVGRASLTYDETVNARDWDQNSAEFEITHLCLHRWCGGTFDSFPPSVWLQSFIATRSNSNDPDYDESANDLGRKIKHLLKTSEKFWKPWKKEYLHELREFQHFYPTSKGAKDLVRKGQTDTVYDEGQPRGLWKVGRIERVIQGPDGKIQSARVRVMDNPLCWSDLYSMCIHLKSVVRILG